MKRIPFKIILVTMVFASLAFLCGCGGDDGPDTDGGRPADITGTWTGFRIHSGDMMTTKYQVQMIIKQNGTRISGTYVAATAASTPFNNQDRHSDVSGTYDSSTGVFMWGSRRITFIDDNTMYYSDDTTLYRL